MKMPKGTSTFVTGAVAGAVIISIVGLTNRWVITSSENKTQVSDAWINAQAQVCVARVEAHLKKTNTTENLSGYDSAASQARQTLAQTYAVALPGEKAPKDIVVTACADKLNKSPG